MSGASAASCERRAHATAQPISAIPVLGRRQHGGTAVHRIVRALQQATFGKTPDDALDGCRVHGGQPAEQVLGDALEFDRFEQSGELGGGQPDFAGDFLEQRNVPLMRTAQQESDVFFDQEPSMTGLLAIG